MGKPYSDDLRERVVAAIEAGQTRVQVANLYQPSEPMTLCCGPSGVIHCFPNIFDSGGGNERGNWASARF
jgi:hypothetical protein